MASHGSGPVGPDGNGIIQVFVNTLNGKSIIIDVGEHDSVWDIKQKIESKTYIPIDQQVLKHKWKVMQDTGLVQSAIDYYELEAESNLYLSASLEEGVGEG